jgi:hypothetical protein
VELLLGELSSLPLAIVYAAAYINATGTTIRDYRALLDEKKRAIAPSEKSSNSILLTGTRDVVATAWLILFEQLRRAHPTAADYLCFIACIASKDVPLELLVLTSTRETDEAI